MAKTPAVLLRLKYPRFVFKVTQPLLAQSARSFINEKNNPNATFFKLYMSGPDHQMYQQPMREGHNVLFGQGLKVSRATLPLSLYVS